MVINIESLKKTMLVVFLNLNMREGIFIVYELLNGRHKQIYEKRGPVIGTQTYWDANLVFTMRLGSGTGYWIDQLYVLRFTEKGCKEVFNDYAQYVKVLPEVEPGTQVQWVEETTSTPSPTVEEEIDEIMKLLKSYLPPL